MINDAGKHQVNGTPGAVSLRAGLFAAAFARADADGGGGGGAGDREPNS